MQEPKVILSAELLGMIFQYLPFIDIENLIAYADGQPKNDSYIANLTDCLKEFKYRMDPTSYISKYFKNGKLVLRRMAEAGCIFTASRALEHIVPGVVHSNSDWNLFIAPARENIVYIMQSLEKQGVVWLTKLERIEYMIQFNPDIEDARAYIERSKIDIDRYLSRLETGAIDSRNILIDTHTISGYILYKGAKIMVNLTYSIRGETPVQLIKRMDHSAIQCFISEVGIGHFYYTSACKKETYLWTNYWSLGTVKKIYQDSQYNIVKYDDFESTSNCIVRSLSDDIAKYINYANFSDKRISSVCWYQFPDFLVHYDSPYEALAKDDKSQYSPKVLLYQRLDNRTKNIHQYLVKYIVIREISPLPFSYNLPMYI